MFLLKPTRGALPASGSPLFTFHNVSIKTRSGLYAAYKDTTLHSTMFLLKRLTRRIFRMYYIDFTFHNVSIKTAGQKATAAETAAFTFHNVSIKTGTRCITKGLRKILYIPQCFY